MLASKRVRCGSNDRVTLRLKASKALKRKLNRARGSVKVTVRVRMGSGETATTHSRKLHAHQEAPLADRPGRPQGAPGPPRPAARSSQRTGDC